MMDHSAASQVSQRYLTGLTSKGVKSIQTSQIEPSEAVCLLDSLYSIWIGDNDAILSSSLISFSPSVLKFLKDTSKAIASAREKYQLTRTPSVNIKTAELWSQVLNTAASTVKSSHTSPHFDYYVIKAWMFLLVSKIQWFCCGDLVEAETTLKKALSYSTNRSVTESTEVHIVKLECMLFAADMYEALGRCSRTVDLFQDAMEIASDTLRDKKLCELVAVHAERANIRMNGSSQRLKEIVKQLPTKAATREHIRNTRDLLLIDYFSGPKSAGAENQRSVSSSELSDMSLQAAVGMTLRSSLSDARSVRKAMVVQSTPEMSLFQRFSVACSTASLSLERSSGHMSTATAGGVNAIALVQNAMMGDAQAEGTLRDLLAEVVPADGSSRLCFLGVDAASDHVIACRSAHVDEYAVSCFPGGRAMIDLVSRWEALIEKTHSGLQGFKDAAFAASLSDQEKERWWHNRRQVDQDMQGLLDEIEEVLAPAMRWVLQVARNVANDDVDEKDDAGDLRTPMRSVNMSQLNTDWTCDEAGDDEFDRLVSSLADELHLSPTSDDNPKQQLDAQSPPASSAKQNFDSMTVPTLKSLLRTRGLPVTGKKADLVERLEQHDRQMPPQPPHDHSSSSRTPAASTTATPAMTPVATSRHRPATMTFTSIKTPQAPRATTTAAQTARRAGTAMTTTSTTTTQKTPRRNDTMTLTQRSCAKSVKFTQQQQQPPSPALHEGHAVFILDEQLAQLPLECLPTLRQRSVSRVPSLCLLVHLIAAQRHRRRMSTANADNNSDDDVAVSMLSARNTWFAVDPENNLAQTRETVKPFFDRGVDKWQWTGYVGSAPSAATIRNHQQSADVFVYCGHGAGDGLHGLHSTSSSASSASSESTACIRPPPAALLWGCSSGRLQSRGVHDPSGPALSYLCQGALCVLGNLWDVTDRDIDRLALHCMQQFFSIDHLDVRAPKTTKKVLFQDVQSEQENDPSGANNHHNQHHQHAVRGVEKGPSLAICLAEARDVCRMRYAVGSAAVLYALPPSLDLSS